MDSRATSNEEVALPMDWGRGSWLQRTPAFVDVAGQVAGCMSLELSAPRAAALTLIAADVLALLASVAATSQRSPAIALQMARPPPARRRQALLGVFLS